MSSPPAIARESNNPDHQPGTPAFQTHARCPWHLPTPSGTLDHTSLLSSYKSHFTGGSAEKEEISLKVPEPATSKKKGKKGSSGPSSLNDNGAILENLKRSDKGNETKKMDTESEGMILDRVVEGGLEGVEGMPPSRMSSALNGMLWCADDRPGWVQGPDIGRRHSKWGYCICTGFPTDLRVVEFKCTVRIRNKL